jgi:hypothetical protein
MEMPGRKTSISKMKITMESNTNRLDQAEEKMSGIKENVKEMLHSNNTKERKTYIHSEIFSHK